MVPQEKIENHIDAAIRFFLFVLIAMLPYSSAAVEICVSFSMVLWGVKRTIRLMSALKSNESVKKSFGALLTHYMPVETPVNGFIYWFMFACLLSSIGCILGIESFRAFFTKIFEWFIIYFIVVEVIVEKKHIKTIFALFFITSFILMFDGILQYYVLRKDIFLGRVLKAGDRATAAFKTPSDFGAFLTVCVPTFFALLFYRENKKSFMMISLCGFCLGLWSLWIVQARAAWMGVVFAFFLCTILKSYQWSKIKLSFISRIILLCCVGIVLCIVFYIFKEFLQYRINTVEWRKEIWISSLRMINDKLIFGHGVNTFMRIFQEYNTGAMDGPTYAHNSILQMAAETGIFGLFWFLMILGKLFSYGYERLCQNNQDKFIQMGCLGFLSGTVALFIQSISDTSFQSVQLSALFWYVGAVAIAGVKMNDQPFHKSSGVSVAYVKK